MFRAACVVASLVLAAGAARAEPKRLRIDPAKSKVYVLMLKAPSTLTSFSHDHALRAPDVEGEVVYDANDPKQSKVSVRVKTDSIVADEPATRQRFGLQGQPTDRDLVAINEDMKGAEFLDVAKNPALTFTSTYVDRGDDGRVTLGGDLTIRGKTKYVEMPVTLTNVGAEVQGNARVVVKQSDFGIKPCNKYLGAIKCADEVTLLLFLVAKP
jgi:polyisoprenoid-binding protein YceI